MKPGILMTFLYGLLTRMVVFLFLIVLTFLAPRLLPGDPVQLAQSSDLTRSLTASEIVDLQLQLGVSGPWPKQLWAYLTGLVQGDLGYSVPHAASVTSLLANTLPWSLLLLTLAAPVILGLGVWGGIAAVQKPGSCVDRLATAMVTVLASLPPFTSALLLLLVFGILWPVFPSSGAEPVFPSADGLTRSMDIFLHAVLPALALALHEVSRFFFLVRGETLSLSQRSFVINARARGVTGWRMTVTYFGRNLLVVIVARLSDTLTGLFGAVLFVEIVFSYPGTGLLIYNAVLERDYAVLQGIVVVLAALVLALNWVVDATAENLARRG